MANERRRPVFSRRDLLKGVSVASAAGAAVAAAPGQLLAEPVPTAVQAATPNTTASARSDGPRREAYEYFTAEEAELLEAIADHLIPADENGPGAVEARAVHYIDRSLAGPQEESREAYRSGLAAFDRYCRDSRGAAFRELPANDQISALIDVETGSATGARVGFVGSSAGFFQMVRSHVIHGTFGDPHYGGNADFVGWELLGYPGVRVSVTSTDQRRLEAGELDFERESAWEWSSFHRSEDGSSAGEVENGD